MVAGHQKEEESKGGLSWLDILKQDVDCVVEKV